MTITFPRPFPTAIRGFEEWEPMDRDAIATTRSPFTFARRSYDWLGSAIIVRATVVLDADDEAPAFNAFIDSLKGTYQEFEFGPPFPLRGAGGGTPLVNGANQNGQSLITDGWPNSTLVLKARDPIAVEANLYFMLQDVTTDGSGNATLDMWPALRSSPADNAPITTVNPKGIFTFMERPTVPRNVTPYVRVPFMATDNGGQG